MAYTLKTFGDIINAVREELKIQSTDTTSLNRIRRDINIVYEEVIADHKWWWLQGAVDLQLESYINAGTASVTQNSNVVTLTIAPASSKAKYKFSVDGFEEIYTIDAHTAGATTLVLDGVFTGNTNPTVTYKIWTDKLALPSDLKETSEITHDYINQPMESVGLQEFRRVARAQPKFEGKPRYYYTADYVDPVEATNASIPSLLTRASSGITKTLVFSSTVPVTIVAGARLNITKPGDPSYAGDVSVATVSTTTVTNDTITFTGRSPLDESATADSSMSIKLVGSENNNTRYRQLFFHPSLNSSRTTLHIDYLKEVLTLDADSDEPVMPMADRVVLLYGALSRAWTRERNPEAAAGNHALYTNKLAKMAGKLQDSFDQPRLTPSRRYLSSKRSSTRGNLLGGSNYQFMEGFGSGSGASNPTGTASHVAVYDSNGNLASSAATTSTELGYVHGVTSAIQTQLDSKIAAPLTGDVTTSASAATVASVGGSTAANVHAAELLANAATSVKTNNAIVKRDGAGAAALDVTGNLTGNVTGNVTGNLTGNVTGNVSGTAATFTGSLTGDVTSTGMSTTIANNAVTNAKAAQMAAHTFKGNNTGSTANAVDMTATQATAELNAMVGDSGSGGTKGLVPAPAAGDAAAAKFLKADGTWQPSAGGTVTSVTFTGDGTVLSSTPSSAVTTTGTVTASLKTQTARTFLQGPTGGSAAAPTFAALTPPTIQRFTSTGTQTGWLFTISTSSTVAVGDTYTNNSNTYTVQGALSAQSGQVLFMSGTGATSGTTLTRATGSGTASITFSTKVATATYTTPSSPAPLSLVVKLVGGGGGGGSSNTTGTDGGNGGDSAFGANIVFAYGGHGGYGASPNYGLGGTGLGTAAVTTSGTVLKVHEITGGDGQPGMYQAANVLGGAGGASALGGQGSGGLGTLSGTAGKANTGGGGGGGGTGAVYSAGGGGQAGGYAEAIITSPAASYPYVIGAAGAASTGGSYNGLAGGSGVCVVEERYQ